LYCPRRGQPSRLISLNPSQNTLIKNNEMDRTVLKGVGGRPENALESFFRESVFPGHEIQIVVANHIVPGKSGARVDLVVNIEKIEVVAHNVAKGHAKGDVQFCKLRRRFPSIPMEVLQVVRLGIRCKQY